MNFRTFDVSIYSRVISTIYIHTCASMCFVAVFFLFRNVEIAFITLFSISFHKYGYFYLDLQRSSYIMWCTWKPMWMYSNKKVTVKSGGFCCCCYFFLYQFNYRVLWTDSLCHIHVLSILFCGFLFKENKNRNRNEISKKKVKKKRAK